MFGMSGVVVDDIGRILVDIERGQFVIRTKVECCRKFLPELYGTIIILKN